MGPSAAQPMDAKRMNLTHNILQQNNLNISQHISTYLNARGCSPQMYVCRPPGTKCGLPWSRGSEPCKTTDLILSPCRNSMKTSHAVARAVGLWAFADD